jgi:hypothetical protein
LKSFSGSATAFADIGAVNQQIALGAVSQSISSTVALLTLSNIRQNIGKTKPTAASV